MPEPIVFTASPLDRAGDRRQDKAWLAALLDDPNTRFLPLWQLKVLIDLQGEGGAAIAWANRETLGDYVRDEAVTVFLGLEDDRAHFAVAIEEDGNPAKSGRLAGGGKFIDVRSIAPNLSVGDAAILAQARSMTDWHLRHRFCAACGAPTTMHEAGYSRRCTETDCAAQHFPRTDPVVIMLVVDGDRCLLGRQPHFAANAYSALAGFVEPGESIEEAVRREVAEEAGITVGQVAYVASQPWPFPSSLMIGCQAEALDSTINIDADELEDARWFDRDQIREMAGNWRSPEGLRLPPPLAIAHQLVLDWMGMR